MKRLSLGHCGLCPKVPEGAARDQLAEDYRQMVEDGLLLEDAESFDVLLQRCGEIERHANVAMNGT